MILFPPSCSRPEIEVLGHQFSLGSKMTGWGEDGPTYIRRFRAPVNSPNCVFNSLPRRSKTRKEAKSHFAGGIAIRTLIPFKDSRTRINSDEDRTMRAERFCCEDDPAITSSTRKYLIWGTGRGPKEITEISGGKRVIAPEIELSKVLSLFFRRALQEKSENYCAETKRTRRRSCDFNPLQSQGREL